MTNRCALCGHPLGDSPSDDFCRESCARLWAAQGATLAGAGGSAVAEIVALRRLSAERTEYINMLIDKMRRAW